MKNIKGNLRPNPTMPLTNSELLPSARIRCSDDKIQVGGRTYQSASDALSAYMQQFDKRQQNGADVKNPLSGVTGKSGILSPVRRKRDPANVTGLLTGSPDDVLGTSLNSMSSSSHLLSNGVGSGPHAVKHSVSFALPDSPRSSMQHSRQPASFDLSAMSQTWNGSRQHSTSLFDSKHYSSTCSHTAASPDLLSFSHLDSTSASQPHNTRPTGDITGLSGASKSSGNQDGGQSTLGSTISRLTYNGQQSVGSPADSLVYSKTTEAPKDSVQQAKSEVEALLTDAPTQSELNALTQASAGEEKLKSLLQETSVPRSSSTSSTKSALQQEVEEALSRSAQLLENIKTDALVSPRCVSDVGSLNTDILLSINPQNPADTIPAASKRESRSRHRYSYHTPAHHPRSLSLGPMPSGPEQRSLHQSGRRRSVESLGPDPSFLGRSGFQDLGSSVSDSESVLKQLPSAGASSLSGLRGENAATNPRTTGPPSWIQELIPPNSANGKDLSDTVFSERDATGGRKAPSWVNGLEHSEVGSSVATQDLQDAAETLALGGKTLHGADLVSKAFQAAIKADESAASELSYAAPGLNYSDLMSPAANRGSLNSQHHPRPAAKVSRNNSFSGVGTGVRRELDRSKPPVTMSRFYQDLAGVDTTRPKSVSPAPKLSSSLGADSSASVLRRHVGQEAKQAQHTMDNYLSHLNGEGGLEAGLGARSREQRLTEIPRCSSMLNGVGGHQDTPSDVTGASSVTKDSNFSNKLCLDDPTLTPARQNRLLGQMGQTGGGGSSGDPDLLEGDRPWEAILSPFKAPVYVGSHDLGEDGADLGRSDTPTLSGGMQPGSMEALKQMLFRLQNEEASNSPLSAAAAALQDNGSSDLMPALKDYDFEVEPGGQSLERALVHLGRLKTLVQTGATPTHSSLSHQQTSC